jgi:predicted phosphodiesterase
MAAGFQGAAFAKPSPELGNPVTNVSEQPRFLPLPLFTGTSRALPLEAILPGVTEQSRKAGRLVFHSLGDTGGIHGSETQNAVAAAMQDQIAKAEKSARPKFFFHLGDIVYFNGQSKHYIEQFYEPYQYYDAPIFAIPGNHDGDTAARPGEEPESAPSLSGFMQNFCSQTPSRFFKHRTTMTQPYCYWRLEAPFVHIIGLYSNVDGQLDARGSYQQQSWLVEQLASAPADKWVVVAAHHPCFSLDAAHGGYAEILSAMDAAFAASNRLPDVVLSGHVHSYQRFSRVLGETSLPYIVAGGGGFANSSRSLHKLQTGLVVERLPFQTTHGAVALESYDVMNSGFLRLTADPDRLTIDYFSVSFGDPPVTSSGPKDSIAINYRNAKKTA